MRHPGHYLQLLRCLDFNVMLYLVYSNFGQCLYITWHVKNNIKCLLINLDVLQSLQLLIMSQHTLPEHCSLSVFTILRIASWVVYYLKKNKKNKQKNLVIFFDCSYFMSISCQG